MALSLSIELETGTGTGGESPGSPSSGLPTGTATAGTSLTSPFTVQLSATGTLGASPGSPSSVQLVALNDTSLPLAATVLTLTLEVASEETGPALAETEALGIVASLVAPGISAGQGSLSAARGGGSEGDPIEGSDEPGATGPDVSAVLAPWERFVLGLDEALEEQERAGAGGLMGPSEPGDRPAPSPREVMPAEGGGSGLRSVPDRPPGAESGDPAISLPANSTGAIDAVNAGFRTPGSVARSRQAGRCDRRGDRDPGCRSVGRPPRRGQTPRSPARDRFRRPGARVRRRLPPGVPTGAPRARHGDPASPAGRRERRVAVAIVRESARRSKGYPPTAASRSVDDVIPFDPDPRTHRLRPSSREPTGPVPSPTGAGAESIQ